MNVYLLHAYNAARRIDRLRLLSHSVHRVCDAETV